MLTVLDATTYRCNYLTEDELSKICECVNKVKKAKHHKTFTFNEFIMMFGFEPVEIGEYYKIDKRFPFNIEFMMSGSNEKIAIIDHEVGIIEART